MVSKTIIRKMGCYDMKVLEIEGRYVIPDKKAILIKDVSELNELKTKAGTCAPGSYAYTADLTTIAILDEDGNWVQV